MTAVEDPEPNPKPPSSPDPSRRPPLSLEPIRRSLFPNRFQLDSRLTSTHLHSHAASAHESHTCGCLEVFPSNAELRIHLRTRQLLEHGGPADRGLERIRSSVRALTERSARQGEGESQGEDGEAGQRGESSKEGEEGAGGDQGVKQRKPRGTPTANRKSEQPTGSYCRDITKAALDEKEGDAAVPTPAPSSSGTDPSAAGPRPWSPPLAPSSRVDRPPPSPPVSPRTTTLQTRTSAASTAAPLEAPVQAPKPLKPSDPPPPPPSSPPPSRPPRPKKMQPTPARRRLWARAAAKAAAEAPPPPPPPPPSSLLLRRRRRQQLRQGPLPPFRMPKPAMEPPPAVRMRRLPLPRPTILHRARPHPELMAVGLPVELPTSLGYLLMGYRPTSIFRVEERQKRQMLENWKAL